MTNDEILQAAKEATNNQPIYGRKEFTFSAEELERFATIIEKRTIERCAVACNNVELAKQNEHIGAIQNGKFQWNTDGGPEKWRARKDFSGKLYTFPPTAEQIANETAEAIARMLENGSFLTPESRVALAANGAAKAIRSGVWKEFKK